MTQSKPETSIPYQIEMMAQVRHICTYWSEDDEGTAGYSLSEEQFAKLFKFITDREQAILSKVEQLVREAQISENDRYMTKSYWYYPADPKEPYIPVVQIKERIEWLQKEKKR